MNTREKIMWIVVISIIMYFSHRAVYLKGFQSKILAQVRLDTLNSVIAELQNQGVDVKVNKQIKK